jgi:putative DNA primase/helicase
LRANEFFSGEVVVITNMETENSLREWPAATNVVFTHYNATSGLDRYRGVSCIITIGRPLPRPDVVEDLAKAVYSEFPESIVDGWYETGLKVISLRNGKGVEVRSSMHQDPNAQSILNAITETELVQAIGRGRGVNRGEKDPLQIDILTNVALPIVVDEVCRWKDVRPRIPDQMVLRGVILTSPADAFKAYPDLFPSPDAARKALDRSGISRTFSYKNSYIRDCPLNRVTYRPQGRGQQTRRALFNPRLVEDIADWLTNLLGPLTQCLVQDPE